jgi:hypothetical protein
MREEGIWNIVYRMGRVLFRKTKLYLGGARVKFCLQNIFMPFLITPRINRNFIPNQD